MTDKLLSNVFQSMYMDAVDESSPEASFLFALNAVPETADYNSFGLANESSTELLARFPAGFKLRGWLDLTDKNRFLVALYNPVKGISEIGFVDRDRKEYVKYVNDEPWTQKLNFGIQNRIYFSFYTKGLCEETHVQFSANHIYYVLNIDESFCSVQYSDMLLFDCNCAVALKHQ